MPARKPEPAPVANLAWYRRVPRRDWLVFVFVELIAVALLITGVTRGDVFGLVAGLALGLVYAPLRAGGWKLFRPWFSRSKAKEDKRDEAFYRKRK
ncbi:MAG: hypothetical protein C0506_07920 [Anaerolinea sp.]|nr:hypothetical protein [Anaerolinea sp.]